MFVLRVTCGLQLNLGLKMFKIILLMVSVLSTVSAYSSKYGYEHTKNVYQCSAVCSYYESSNYRPRPVPSHGEVKSELKGTRGAAEVSLKLGCSNLCRNSYGSRIARQRCRVSYCSCSFQRVKFKPTGGRSGAPGNMQPHYDTKVLGEREVRCELPIETEQQNHPDGLDFIHHPPAPSRPIVVQPIPTPARPAPVLKTSCGKCTYVHESGAYAKGCYSIAQGRSIISRNCGEAGKGNSWYDLCEETQKRDSRCR